MARHPELLIPASSLEVLKTAVVFGADAVYIGGEAFGLRAKAKNFSKEDMMEGIRFAHEHDVKVYVTANILADVIIPIAGIVDRFLKPGGVFISSGIIYMKEEEVKDAINNNSNLQLSKVVNQGDWRAIMAIKK